MRFDRRARSTPRARAGNPRGGGRIPGRKSYGTQTADRRRSESRARSRGVARARAGYPCRPARCHAIDVGEPRHREQSRPRDCQRSERRHQVARRAGQKQRDSADRRSAEADPFRNQQARSRSADRPARSVRRRARRSRVRATRRSQARAGRRSGARAGRSGLSFAARAAVLPRCPACSVRRARRLRIRGAKRRRARGSRRIPAFARITCRADTRQSTGTRPSRPIRS